MQRASTGQVNPTTFPLYPAFEPPIFRLYIEAEYMRNIGGMYAVNNTLDPGISIKLDLGRI